MNVRVSLEGPSPHEDPMVFVVLSTHTVGELCRQLLTARGVDPQSTGGPWMVSSPDGSWYAEGPLDCAVPLGRLAQGSALLRLALYPTTICRHGSPWVRGQGHLCGWC